MKELAQGVRLHVLPTKKYKTISIKFKFKTALDRDTITKRSLVSRLLETNSQQYPTQTDFQYALSKLYGANFGSGVSKKGLLHIVSLSMSVVNDKYLTDKSVLEEALSFFHSVLFQPNAFQGGFHKETLEREIENLRDDFESIYDNKSEYAALAIQGLYFDQLEQQIPASGRMQDLNNLTPENVYEVYRSMIENDEVDIYVLGDVDEDRINEIFSDFEFEDREEIPEDVFFQNESDHFKVNEEIHDVTQAKLNIAYDTNIYYHNDAYYAGQVFNGLFGGFPHSKLFINVREKESLAYHASSRLDTFRGVMYVQTGIDKDDSKKVIKIVAEQLGAVQQGDFDEETLVQTKEMIKNGLLQSQDSAGGTIERSYAQHLIDNHLTIDEWCERIDAVTKEDVIKVARAVNLKATFLLKGEDKIDE